MWENGKGWQGTVFAKPRRLDPEWLAAAKEEFAQMEKAWIISRSTSPWSSPLHIVKKDGGWRPCGDYRRLNNITVPDRYPLPLIADFTSRISGSTEFSRLDLQKGYYQIPMASVNVPKSAISSPLLGCLNSSAFPLASRMQAIPSSVRWIRS